jgi:molybdate transport system permease protein
MMGRRATILAALAVLGLYGALLASLAWFLEPAALGALLTSRRVWFSLRLSLGAATLATALALLLALPAAYALSRHRFRGQGAVETVLEFPLIVSPAALGAALLIFFANPLGAWLQENTIHVVFTLAGVVLAQFVTILGVAVRMLKVAFDEVPHELETVARSLGAGPGHVFRTVTLPLARRGLVASLVLVWAKALGEFGATLMVAGSMAMRTETLPIAIFMRLSTADIEGTVALILLLVCLGLGALYLARRLLRSPGHA